MKMTFQPKKRQRSKVHGFRKRMSTANGRKVLSARRAKGRNKLTAQAADMWPFSLGKCMKFSESLKKNQQFKAVYESGTSFANRYLVVYKLENGLKRNRLGISVSKKVGNSIVRHHLARLIRENYRLSEELYKEGFDIVVIARVSAKKADYYRIGKSLSQLSEKLGLLKDSDAE